MVSHAPHGSLGRLAVIGPSAAALSRLRGGLISAAVAQGFPVLALSPDAGASGAEGLLKLGAEVQSFKLRPDGFSLFPKRRAVAALTAQLQDWHPHTVLAFGAKIIPLAVLAARRAKIAHIAVLMSEIGPQGLSGRLRAAVRAAGTVIAHNREDERTLRTLLGESSATVVRVPGTGADLSIAPGCPMAGPQEKLTFVALSRLDRVKGVHDYLEAARLAQAAGINAQFKLAGPDGVEAGAVNSDTLSRYAACVDYIGNAADPVTTIRGAHVFVSPSHLEGMPPDVLTALAAGRPIVATDIAGSRDTVDEMVNGTLVAPSDPASLAEGFARLDRNRALLASMAQASRSKAERMFGSQEVHAALLKALQLS